MQDGDRTTSGFSWLAQLQAHLNASGKSLSAQRQSLADLVLENPTSPEAWLRFLEGEEAAAEELRSSPEDWRAWSTGLYRLYHKATELAQRGKGRDADAYMRIWLGYARFQW